MGYRMSYMICKMVVAAKRGADDEKKSAKKPDSFTWNYSFVIRGARFGPEIASGRGRDAVAFDDDFCPLSNDSKCAPTRARGAVVASRHGRR
jgi:hypothetical protein